ncbi:hypothetical protein [Micromonospora sp. CB01531]|uniref:hypothetical protein n=1 Tax=Micromonospora sp. CB01531 TaxID=1718947 RepID=UPI000AC42F04|nr:hypothetical protein [Micromonospora sp. CB01531]
MDDDLTPPPALLALLDQDRAVLVDLVAAAAQHSDAEACPHAGICPGQHVVDVVHALDPADRDRLLHLAVAALALAGYAAPARYRLTRAGYAALDAHPPGRRWPFGGRHA